MSVRASVDVRVLDPFGDVELENLRVVAVGLELVDDVVDRVQIALGLGVASGAVGVGDRLEFGLVLEDGPRLDGVSKIGCVHVGRANGRD